MINNGGKIGITIVIKYDGGSSSHKLYIYISDILFHEQQIKKSSLTWDELKNAVDDFPISESDINTILFNVAAEEEYDKNINHCIQVFLYILFQNKCHLQLFSILQQLSPLELYL